MKQIVSNYSYSPATNVVTLTGVNIDQDQLLLVVAPQVGRTMYNFASVTGSVVAGSDTRVTLNASTVGLTTTSPLVIFYDDQASAQAVTGTVALDPASLVALENITVTVGAAVSISNFPSTQTIAGTVTANLSTKDYIEIENIRVATDSIEAKLTNPLPISGTVTVGNFPATQPVSIASVTIGNSITIGSFSTSVTARLVDPTGTAVSYASTGTAGNPSSDVISIQGVSGGTSVPVSISSVTIGAVPNGALTTRFGSVATANTAQISSAVTNTSRKYLLIQNVTTSSNVITVGIGFTPTTTQGIQLSAGAGITFESSYIPTGAVYILSSVTASPFTILEA